jgi:plastocyanin
MGKPFKTREIEKEHGPLDPLVPNIVNEAGSQKAAAERLQTSQSTISTILKQLGYVPITVYVKPGTKVEWDQHSITA